MKFRYINKILVLLFFSLTVFQTSCKKEKNRICELYEGSVDYAVGFVESSTSVPTRVKYKYSFVVDGVTYDGTEKVYGIGHDENRIIGNQYIVVYQQGDPSNSDLNFNFLIDTEQDFEEFVETYQNGPPSPDFPNKCK